MTAAVSGLSPVIITVRMPIAPEVGEALGDARLHDVLQVDHAERRGAADLRARLGDDERRAALRRDRVDGVAELAGNVAALLLDPAAHRVGRALADAPVRRSRRRSCGSAR